MEHGPSPIFSIGPLAVTNTVFTAWIVSGVIILLVRLVTAKMAVVPGRGQSIVEMIVEQFIRIGEQVADARRARQFLPLVATLFIFIVTANWMGTLPFFAEGQLYVTHDDGHGHVAQVNILKSPNSDLNVTLAMALIAFFAFETAGFMAGGLAYAKEFIWPGMLIEIVSHLSRPVALSLRLFGNIMAGEVVVSVMKSLVPLVIPAIFIGFELFVGLVQALIFSLLTLAFLAMSTAHASHGEGHHEPAGAGGGAAHH